MKKSVKILIVVLCLIIVGLVTFIVVNQVTHIKKEQNESESISLLENTEKLPFPEITGGERGKLGIDKNINESNIDNYLERNDSVYRDMRMLEDPGNYEAIGGDSYLSGYIKGFEVVPLPYIIPVKNLPKEVGNTYTGDTLFGKDENGTYFANYTESISIIEELFPKDKYIFLICGGGGYAGMMREFLISLGWDANKIYNIGGYWYYDGANVVEVKKYVDGKVTYDFDKVPYHNIDFKSLTKINESDSGSVKKVKLDSIYYTSSDEKFDELDLNAGFGLGEESEKELFDKAVQAKADIVNNLIYNDASFVVIVQNINEACRDYDSESDFEISGAASLIMREHNVYYYNINLPIFKKTQLYQTVKYAPTVIVIEKGEIISYIDANKDSFNDESQLEKWLTERIEMNK